MGLRPFAVGDRIRFIEEKRPYAVQAVSATGRYLACTKPFAARRTVIYTVVDRDLEIRGVDDSMGNSLGYETREDCEHAVAQFEAGEFGFSRRHRPIPCVLCEERPITMVFPDGSNEREHAILLAHDWQVVHAAENTPTPTDAYQIIVALLGTFVPFAELQGTLLKFRAPKVDPDAR